MTLKYLPVFAIFLVGVYSCGEKEPSKDPNVVEVAGLCQDGDELVLCANSKIPKYFRQIINVDATVSDGDHPQTLGSIQISTHIKRGFLIPEIVGFKYRIKGNSTPGDAGHDVNLTNVNASATVYEVFREKIDGDIDVDLGLKNPIDTVQISPSRRLNKYSRRSETVVVIYRENHADRAEGLNCSARGHLYYFGIKNVTADDLSGYFFIGDRMRDQIKFSVDDISNAIKGN